MPRTSRRFLALTAAVCLAAACSSSSSSSSSGSSASSASSWNDERFHKGFDAAANREALAVLGRIGRAGVECNARQTEAFNVLIKSYTLQKLPFPLGSASCTGPDQQNLLVELFPRRGYPSGADFMARKRGLVCQKALDLGKDVLPGHKNGFKGIPYVIAKDRSWVIEPDSFRVNRLLARALGLRSLNACARMKAR